jgi:gamma-glutamylaminecyclotransferase
MTKAPTIVTVETTPTSPARAVEICPLVFVYGTLKRGHMNHRILEHGNAEFLGTAATLRDHSLFVDGLPYLVEGTHEDPGSHQVRGELYKVDAETMASLDRLEGHPRFYERRLARFVYSDRHTPDGAAPRAWVYYHPWSPQFLNLTPLKEYK